MSLGFGKWAGIHNTAEQQTRLARAQEAECTPLSICDGVGHFSGSSGEYLTTLGACQCVDFMRRKLPCKHIYRLAIELGEMEGTVKTDMQKVKHKVDHKDAMSLCDLVSIVENITNEAQIYLKDILLNILFRKKNPIKLKDKAELQAVISLGILEPCEGGYTIGQRAQKSIRKLYTYLIRKYDNESYFDLETGTMKECPKGAIFTATVSIDGNIESGMQFPDDEVTELLNLFNVNRCNK